MSEIKTRSLRDMNIKELSEFFVSIGEKPFRAKQVFTWLARGCTSFEEMTDLPLQLRESLYEKQRNGELSPGDIDIIKKQISKKDGTVKYLFGLSDGSAVESVFMKYKYGNSICVSSQAGCRMGCTFCASARGGLHRDLSPGEIIMQLLKAQNDTGEKISRIVVMGTGEPFDNYENLKKFIELVHEPLGLNISHRNITVSTCGLVPMIMRFAKDFPQVNLAISLHAPNDELRSRMMPVNKSFPLDALLAECIKYTAETGRRITYEYALVSGVNDSSEAAKELIQLLKGTLCHVNLIPLNDVEESGLRGSSRKRAEEFRSLLEAAGIAATVRRELGADIDAACGQLRLSTLK